ncbi:MAG: hypothetical protein RMZ69_05140 [Nostoc sp. ChiQUE01a]|nr:hypothetical protein [Nostoc sp. ChiQUE01a]
MPKANAPSIFDRAALGDNIPYLLFFVFLRCDRLSNKTITICQKY